MKSIAAPLRRGFNRLFFFDQNLITFANTIPGGGKQKLKTDFVIAGSQLYDCHHINSLNRS